MGYIYIYSPNQTHAKGIHPQDMLTVELTVLIKGNTKSCVGAVVR